MLERKYGLQLGFTVLEFMLISIRQCLCHIRVKGYRFRGVNGFMVS